MSNDPENRYRPDVVAGKYDERIFDPSGEKLAVNEVFYSIQGEGKNAGQPTVFERLAKCNLACKFCDTEFETFEMHRTPALAEHIAKLAQNGKRPNITFTGGEPALQNLKPLMNELRARGFFWFCMETSGSVWNDWMADINWLCVSPKVPIQRIPPQLIDAAHEAKWIVNAAFLKMYEENPHSMAISNVRGCRNYLQPEWGLNTQKWTVAATKLCLANPGIYTLSLQTHKFAGNP